ncbi:VOC family protein [Treponema sp. OMZ 840]|uniref:VOC family protein n=1 Tax=Treponema sp. OMZ 840 TaxID=244313 RepID=UPI003D8DA58D
MILDHVCLQVSDILWCIELFSNVFGMKISKYNGDSNHPSQVWLDNVLQLNEVRDIISAENTVFGHLAFCVSDTDAVIEKLYDYGGISLPQGFNWIKLPNGIVFEILKQE